MNDRYAFLTNEQWGKVCLVLGEDIKNDSRRGITITAPERPEIGQEPTVVFDLETDAILWLGDYTLEMPLSEVILCSSASIRGEVIRAKEGLQNTIRVLDAYLANHRP